MDLSVFIHDATFFFPAGLICFDIRDTELGDYQGMMLEVEKDGRWIKVSEKKIPLYENDDLPKDILGFVYRVLTN